MMTSSIVSADSLLAIDIGTVTTRALLFDVIGGSYRFIAAGTANTTTASPMQDAGEGTRQALKELETITGRLLTTSDENLIIPSQTDGTGVDTFALTMSAGPPIKVVAVGLLENISLESAKHLAENTYSQVVETISLNDRRQPSERIDAILKARPDLIIIAGGIEGGATLSIRNLLEAVGLASFLMPKGQQPQVLFAGNQAVRNEVNETLGSIADIHVAPNIRPTLEIEQLAHVQPQLAHVFKRIRGQQIHSISELDGWAQGRLLPTSTAFGRVTRFLSKVYDPAKGVLGVDIGAAATTISAGFRGDSVIGVYPEFGLGENLPQILHHTKIETITRWLTAKVTENDVRDYIYNKAAYPASIPVTTEDLAIEQAIARQAIRTALIKLSRSFSSGSQAGLLPGFEPILATGSALTAAPKLSQSLLMLLDSIQPTGITTVLLDKNSLIAALGAAAEVNPILAIQVLSSNTIMNLGTIISPIGIARSGVPILRAKLTQEDGTESKAEVKNGTIEVVPLAVGATATLRLQPLHRFDIGMGPGRSGRVQVVGGALGVVIDARGRPLTPHADVERRSELYKKWLWTLGN
jgi:hypothetical protein